MKKRSGFTIFEVVLVIALTGILSSAIIPALMHAIDSMHYHQIRTAVVSSSRVSTDRLVMEIRRLRSAADITGMTATSFSFVDVDGNAVQAAVTGPGGGPLPVGGPFELRLIRDGVNGVLSTMVDADGGGAAQFHFIYMDGKGNEINPAQAGAAFLVRTIRLVGQFSYPGNVDAFDRPYSISTEVRPPNLRGESALLP